MQLRTREKAPNQVTMAELGLSSGLLMLFVVFIDGSEDPGPQNIAP